MQIRCAISPDADDRFMLRAIELGLIDTEGLDFDDFVQHYGKEETNEL